jgi:hypothetical protein
LVGNCLKQIGRSSREHKICAGLGERDSELFAEPVVGTGEPNLPRDMFRS